MNSKFGLKTVAAAALAASAGSVLLGGTAFAGGHNSHDHNGGDGGRGGKNSAQCLVPVGLSAGAVASQGGNVSQCNANGGNGGNGGAGDVSY